jgi:hypothetical protein
VDLAEIELWRPARPAPFGKAITGYVVLMGFAVAESSGTAAAELDIYNGTDTNGQLTHPITLDAGESTSEWYGPQGIEMAIGVYPVIAVGSVKGTVWIADRRGSNR